MIRFALQCHKGHRFEGWFRNGDTYDRQAKRGEVRCPDCGSPKIKKAIMSPAIGKSRVRDVAPETAAAAPPADSKPSTTAVAIPASAAPVPQAPATVEMHYAGKLREALREMRQFIEKNAEYVGPRFADEARKMQTGEAEERSIYGEATDEEAEALKEEGIEFGRIPWPKYKHDS